MILKVYLGKKAICMCCQMVGIWSSGHELVLCWHSYFVPSMSEWAELLQFYFSLFLDPSLPTSSFLFIFLPPKISSWKEESGPGETQRQVDVCILFVCLYFFNTWIQLRLFLSSVALTYQLRKRTIKCFVEGGTFVDSLDLLWIRLFMPGSLMLKDL